MARPKTDSKMVKFALPADVYARFEKVAGAMVLKDTQSAIRILACLQLAQLEASHIMPKLNETEAEREARATKYAETAIAELLPDPAPVAPAPEHKPFGFGGPRSDADGLADELVEIGQPLVAPGRRAEHATWLNL